MVDVDSFLAHTLANGDDEFLAHYASKYYDPVKAREYYLRTRELKGRAKAEKLSAESRQKQSEAVAYVRDQISTKKTAELNKASTDTSAKIEAMKKKAEDTRKEITDKFEALVESLKAKKETGLNKIPENASPRLRAFLERQNRRLTESINKDMVSAQKNANASIRAVGMNLRSAVSDAREAYRTSRKAITEKYKTDLKTELTNITNKVR